MLFNFSPFLLNWEPRGAQLIGSVIDSQVCVWKPVIAALQMDTMYLNALKAFLCFPQKPGQPGD